MNDEPVTRAVFSFGHRMSSTIMSKEFVSTRYEDDIVKSGEDKRLYRYLKLKNSMQVFLISDSSTDKSAAAMDVHIGES